MKENYNVFNEFYDKLEELMKEQNLSISKLSKETHIPRTTLNNYVLRKNTPKLDLVVTLALYFKVSVDYLLGLED